MIADKFFNSRWLIPALISTIVTLAVIAGANCTYESNDDLGMIGIISGHTGLTAYPDAYLLSRPLSAMLYYLYKLHGLIPWYGMLMYSLLFTGCIAGVRTINRSGGAKEGRLICLVVLLAFYSYLLYRVNFTSVSLFLWLTAIAALSADNLDNTPVSATSWFYGVLLGISYLLRPDLLYLALGFSLPFAATILFSDNRLKRFSAAAVPLLAACLLASSAAMGGNRSAEHKAFAAFNKVRVEYVDTLRSAETEDTGRALLAAGWTPADYLLAKYWWFHDGTIYSAEKLSRFMQSNSAYAAIASAKMLKNAIEQNLLIILMILSALLPVFISGRDKPAISLKKSLLLTFTIGIIVVSIITMMAIRFPLRVAIPLFCHLLLTGALLIPHVTGGWIRSANPRKCIALLSLSTVIYIILTSGTDLRREVAELKRLKFSADESIRSIQSINGSDSILLCANVIGENSFFFAEASSPFREFRDVPDYIFFPIGWMIAFPPYNKFLRDNGFIDRDQAVVKMIDNRRLVLAYWQQDQTFDEYRGLFLLHLSSNYSAMFPGKEIKLLPVLDRRDASNGHGYLFFRIITVPSTKVQESANR